MECVPEERVLLASYQLQAQALTWWSAEWETTFQSRPLRQIPWQEFVVSFERAFCPTYVRTERLYQFLDLQQRDFTVVQYRARFVELGRYAPQIIGDEGLRTQQFVRGLRPELRQELIPRQQQGSVQTTPRTTTSYASTSTGTTAKSGSRRKLRHDRRQAEQRQQSVGSVQQLACQSSQQVQRTFAGQCYRCDQMGHMARDCPLLPRAPQQQTQSQPRVQQQQQQQQAPVQQRQQTGGSGWSRGRGRVTHLTRADAEAAHLVEDSLEELSSGESVELAVELPTWDFVLKSYCLEERYGAVMDCQKKRVHLRIPGEAAFYFQGIVPLTSRFLVSALRAGRGLKSLTSTSVEVEIFRGDIDDMVDGH
ncbi:hypothetical protein Taro_000565 [Colocasia esculenta]|uniref:CCHC-type domain-containing protein n=1 Tax=Colocasia esculenta TaxID=4460 RepID=A0A843TB85_COLES|nr:hypothetical protein [Colocasia esculenta]